MTPNERLVILRQTAERFLQGNAVQGELDLAIHEAAVAGCDGEVIRRVCEVALERVVATMRTEDDTSI
jgi:hypothetical protein